MNLFRILISALFLLLPFHFIWSQKNIHIYKKNNRYYNTKEETIKPYLFSGLKIAGKTLTNKSYLVNYMKGANLQDWYTPSQPQEKSKKPRITWIGHATFLIQLNNINILVDPIFGNLVPFLLRRTLPPGIAFKNLPHIDLVLISHNHNDHMEAVTLKKLHSRKQPPLTLVPVGTKQWFTKRKMTNVEECNWWEKRTIQNSLCITFLPAIHASRRTLFDTNKAMWGSWMIESENFKIYFGGDTAYGSHFSAIKEVFHPIDVAILPISPNEPDKLMRAVYHMNTEQAVEAFLDLGATHFIPMHWGTFKMGLDTFLSPIIRLETWWNINNKSLTNKQKHVLKIGEQLYLEGTEKNEATTSYS